MDWCRYATSHNLVLNQCSPRKMTSCGRHQTRNSAVWALIQYKAVSININMSHHFGDGAIVISKQTMRIPVDIRYPYTESGPWGCFTDVSPDLINNLAKIYSARNNIYAENLKLKLCTCTQGHALGTRTKFQLEILIRSTILVIYRFRENVLESSRNVSETPPKNVSLWRIQPFWF